MWLRLPKPLVSTFSLPRLDIRFRCSTWMTSSTYLFLLWFTLFGQVVIALLIQCGGLGLMTFAIVTLIALGGKIGFLERTVAREAFNQTDSSTLVATAKSVLMFALTVELVGMTILTWYWSDEFGWATSLFHGFFYTISAFNNAGFALSADSLMPYVDDPVVNLTITGLFIIGGLGFSVWMDLKRNRNWSKLAVS